MSQTFAGLSAAGPFQLSVSSLYLLLLVVLLWDGVTQDVQETDVSRWGGRVPKHLQPEPKI